MADNQNSGPANYLRAYFFPPTHREPPTDPKKLPHNGTAIARGDDPTASLALSLGNFINKTLISHPCMVLRRQCQVHQNAGRLHLTPLTLVPVTINMVSRDGLMTLWKGSLGCSVLYGMTYVTEALISDIFGLPRTITTNGSNEKFMKHVMLKAGTTLFMTPFYISSFIGTVRSGTGPHVASVLDVIFLGIDSLRRDLLGEDSGRRFNVLYLTLPTTGYFVGHFLISQWAYNSVYTMAKRYILQKPPQERTRFHSILPDLLAAMASGLAADVIFYPIETILHRLYIQGTRTLIDNLDTGMNTISIDAKYNGFFDCFSSIVRNEGFFALYSGVGAVALQCGLQFCVLRGMQYLFEYAINRPSTVDVGHTSFGASSQALNRSDPFAAIETPSILVTDATSPSSPSPSFDPASHEYSDDEDDTTMSPEDFLNFISSRVKMQDPVSNAPIYPLVSMLELPEAYFEYNSVAKINNVHRGVLHFVLKQANELERFLSKFSIENFPAPTRKVIRLLQTAPDLKSKEYLNTLDKQINANPSLKKLVTELQIMVLDFLREYLSDDHYVGELVDNRGRSRSVWRVYNRMGGEEAMITPFGSALNKPTDQMTRPFREIVSISFAPLNTVSSKMKKVVMHGDWSSTCSSSSKLSF